MLFTAASAPRTRRLNNILYETPIVHSHVTPEWCIPTSHLNGVGPGPGGPRCVPWDEREKAGLRQRWDRAAMCIGLVVSTGDTSGVCVSTLEHRVSTGQLWAPSGAWHGLWVEHELNMAVPWNYLPCAICHN